MFITCLIYAHKHNRGIIHARARHNNDNVTNQRYHNARIVCAFYIHRAVVEITARPLWKTDATVKSYTIYDHNNLCKRFHRVFNYFTTVQQRPVTRRVKTFTRVVFFIIIIFLLLFIYTRFVFVLFFFLLLTIIVIFIILPTRKHTHTHTHTLDIIIIITIPIECNVSFRDCGPVHGPD